MLGNHDAWTCLTKKRLEGKWGTEDDPAKKVRQQLELNGDRNLAWNCKDLPGKPVSVVGARPFSKVRVYIPCTPPFNHPVLQIYMGFPI